MRAAIVCLLLFIVGCGGYTRYSKYRTVTPKDPAPTRGALSTNEFIHLGMILRGYLGKPYKGTSRYDPGLDCSAFTSQVFKEFNDMRLPRTAADQYKTGKEVTYQRLTFGDLVFFRTDRRKISHVGIYVGANEFIHASSSNGVIISNLSERYWADCYAGARRVLE
jgi:hypothetical protein